MNKDDIKNILSFLQREIKIVKSTEDDWYGNELLNICGHVTRVVTCSLMRLLDQKTWRVCVWGNDDFGLEKDSESFDEIYDLFMQILVLPNVNKQKLKDMGLYNA